MSPYEQLFREYVVELGKAVDEETKRLERIRRINRHKFVSEEALEEWLTANFDPVSCQEGRNPLGFP